MHHLAPLALAATLTLGIAGCVYVPLGKIPSLDVTSLASGTLTVKVRPTVHDGGFRTQAIINPWTREDIRYVVLEVYKLVGDDEKPVLQTGENTQAPYQIRLSANQLESEIPFKNLAPDTTYRIRARAYYFRQFQTGALSEDGPGDATLISDDKISFLDIVVKNDDRPVARALPIQLLDRDFDGRASGPLQIENGQIYDTDESLGIEAKTHPPQGQPG